MNEIPSYVSGSSSRHLLAGRIPRGWNVCRMMEKKVKSLVCDEVPVL